MRKFSVVALAASIALAALIATTHPVSAQSAQCEASRSACDNQCGPIATGTPWNGPAFTVHAEAIACRGKCKKSYDRCMMRASVRGNAPLQASQGERPRKPKPFAGAYDGGILNNSGPAFGGQGPAGTGSPAAGAPTAPPPAKIY